MVCTSAFCCYDKEVEIVNLQSEKVYFWIIVLAVSVLLFVSVFYLIALD